jgi:hypothetical protein
MRIFVAIIGLLLSSCADSRQADPDGRYVSRNGDIEESVTLLADGAYDHTWTLNGPNRESGRWHYRSGPETDCPTLELSAFTVVRRDDRPSFRTDTFMSCIEATVFGESSIVLSGDRGVYLTKTRNK